MKILILDGDKQHRKIKVKDKFVFLVTEQGAVYHVDSADGKMYESKAPYENLGEAHRKIVEKTLRKMAKELK